MDYTQIIKPNRFDIKIKKDSCLRIDSFSAQKLTTQEEMIHYKKIFSIYKQDDL